MRMGNAYIAWRYFSEKGDQNRRAEEELGGKVQTSDSASDLKLDYCF